jgi:hypothetical protein
MPRGMPRQLSIAGPRIRHAILRLFRCAAIESP